MKVCEEEGKEDNPLVTTVVDDEDKLFFMRSQVGFGEQVAIELKAGGTSPPRI